MTLKIKDQQIILAKLYFGLYEITICLWPKGPDPGHIKKTGSGFPTLIFPSFPSEMWFLLNVNENRGLSVYEIENGIVEMTQTADMFDRFRYFTQRKKNSKTEGSNLTSAELHFRSYITPKMEAK